jgi:hypothetical protein
MNGTHLHLITTHLPVLGVAFGTALLAVGLVVANRVIQRTALVVLLLAGLTAGVAYLTGESAEETVETALQGAEPYLEQHERAGVVGLVAAGSAAALALVALIGSARKSSLSKALVLLNLIVGLVASGTLAWVANLGGQIGHPEIRTEQTAQMRGALESREEH